MTIEVNEHYPKKHNWRMRVRLPCGEAIVFSGRSQKVIRVEKCRLRWSWAQENEYEIVRWLGHGPLYPSGRDALEAVRMLQSAAKVMGLI